MCLYCCSLIYHKSNKLSQILNFIPFFTSALIRALLFSKACPATSNSHTRCCTHCFAYCT